MISFHPAQQRGHAQHGWLESWHSFSFGNYYDPTKMGFASLRVINDDYIAPSAGFPTHPHRDMEIITYVLSGALAHQDSMGNGSTIYAGDVQKMSNDTLTLLGDEELRRSFGEKGRELAVQRYSTSKIIPQYIAFYEKVLQTANAATA